MSAMRGLNGRAAVVTGGARGIGRAICERLAAEGMRVAVADIDGGGALKVAGEIGRGALGVQLDVTDSSSIRAGVGEVAARFGRIDVLVNNAGWDKVEPFVKSSEETWDKVLAINLRGPIAMTRAVLDGMVERRAGWIVSISSDAGRVGSSGEVVYSAAKAGLIGFSKALAREVARANVHVNVVCPGPTIPPLLAQVGADNPNLVQSLARAVPFGRIGEPEDLAGAVAFLASDDAAFITGQTISVSGGLTMA
jgi:2-hydroxycyclohexanecarboxyl-CoA dehydrogenase